MKRTSILFVICMLAVALTATGTAEKAVSSKAGSAPDQARTGGGAALPSPWTAPVNISNNSAYSSDPYLALDAKGNAYVSWVDWHGGVGSRRDMMFNTNKSGKWGTPRSNQLAYTIIDDVGFPEVTVTQDGNRAIYVWMDGYFAAEPRMAIQGEELVNGAWGGVGIVSLEVSQPSTYPTLSASPVDNTICFVWQQDMDPGFLSAYQYMDGVTGRMSSPELVTPGGQAGGQYFPNLFVDAKGTAHLVYISRMFEARPWYTKNANIKNMSGWTTPIPLSDGTGLDWSFPMVRATDNGDAYVIWQEDHNGIENVFLKYQINGVWQSTINVTNTTTAAPCEYPSIGLNPTTGEMYISWTQLTGSGLGNIYLKTYEIDKTTGQKAWSSAIQATSSGRAEMSSIRGTKDPDIHLVYTEDGEVWYTSRLAPRLTAIAAPTVSSQAKRVLFSSEKTITVNFTKNPENDDATLKEYRLYYKKAEEADSAYKYVTFAPTATLQYVMTKLPVPQKYSFMASVVNKDGLEIKTADVVSN